MTQTTSSHLRAITILGLPLIGSHVAQFAVSLTDAVMLGRYDVEALAAEVLGTTLFFVLFIMGSGFAFAVMPMVAKAQGAGEGTQVRRVTRMGLWVSGLFGLVALPILLASEPILVLAGQEAQTAALAGDYMRINGWSILPALMVMVLKSYLAALERTRVVFWVTVVAVAVNALGNWLLIFGNLGLPEMGIRGAAIASVIVHSVSFLLLALYALKATPEHRIFARFWKVDREAFGEVFRLGWPIGLTNLAEVGLFAASSLMMGWIGTVALAAHGIALQIASVTFMVHLGLSNVATIRAGNALGRGDGDDLRQGARVILVVSGLVAALTVAIFLTLPELLLGGFLRPDDPDRAAVIAIGVSLLAAAALFQVVDAAQVMTLGLLRGVQDTRVPMILAGVSYWVIGVPVSYGLGFYTSLGGVGIWLGLALGLFCAAVLMSWRFWRYSGRNIATKAQRLDPDDILPPPPDEPAHTL